MLGAPLGGTKRGGHQDFDPSRVSLMTPPNFGGGAGSCVPFTVVVALAEPATPVVCWAPATQTVSSRIESVGPSRAFVMNTLPSLWCAPIGEDVGTDRPVLLFMRCSFRCIAFVDPVRLESSLQVQRFHPRETHFFEKVQGRFDVGAAVPRAAAAIEDDLAIARELAGCFPEGGESGGVGSRSGENRPRDVFAAV